MRAVGGFSNILLEDFSTELPPDARDLVGKIARRRIAWGQLIDDLLKFSRLGRQPVARRVVNVAALGRGVADELFKAASGRRIDISVSELPDCAGDPSLLNQVFTNLLSNAFKFTRQKESAVVEVGCQSQNDENVYFVRDNGAGFDMQFAGQALWGFPKVASRRRLRGYWRRIVHCASHRSTP